MEGIAGQQMLIGLFIGLVLLILLILKTKIHTFLALIISAITTGFGNTLGSIGIIIGFGVMMGQIFEMSGAAERMAQSFLKIFGKKNEEFALAITGFLVSIPIFCDSGFVILSPIAKAISKRTKKSIVGLGIALAAGLVITHSLVPPTPGPLGVAGTFGVDVGHFILLGIVIALPMAIGCLLYGKWLGKRIYQLPSEDGESWERPTYSAPVYHDVKELSNKNLPSAFMAFLPLVLPIILILINTVLKALEKTDKLSNILIFLGHPIVAVAIGLVIAIYTLAKHQDKKTVIAEMEKGIKSAGIIILVTGGGGALGQVLRVSGVGDFIAQGSGTVAMVTAAGITAPIVAAAGGNMLLGAFAACIGSLFFSYFNDSFYWVVNRMIGIDDTKEQIRVWSVTTTIAWAIGFVELLILNMIM